MSNYLDMHPGSYRFAADGVTVTFAINGDPVPEGDANLAAYLAKGRVILPYEPPATGERLPPSHRR